MPGKRFYSCVLCNKRPTAKERIKINISQKKILSKILPSFNDDGVLCGRCRLKIYKIERKKSEKCLVENSRENTAKETIVVLNSPLSFKLNIPTAVNSHAYCFICRKPGPKLVVVTIEERFSVFLDKEIIIPAGTRCCPGHFIEGRLSAEDLDNLHCPNQTASFNRVTILQLLQYVRETALRSRTRRLDFDDPGCLSNEDYQNLLGLDKGQFEQLMQYFHLKNTPVRSGRCSLAIFMMKMKTGLPNKLLSTLFNISKSSIKRAIATVRKALSASFVPYYIGFQHISRQDVITKHTRPLAEQIFGENGLQVVLVLDGTYIYIQKSLNFQFQRRSYSVHKGRPLVKPMVIVSTTGYFVSVIGPYLADGKNNDARILEHIMRSNIEDVRDWIDENDVFIVDRGFRDAVPFLSSLGINAEMPAFMKRGEKQMSTEDSNSSRMVTKVRWVVESANARIKRWRFLDHVLPTNQVPYIGDYVRIVCAIANKFYPPLSHGNLEEDQVLAAKMHHLSLQVNGLKDYVEEKELHKRTADWKSSDVDYFPRLDEEQIRQITCGSYQLKLCASYTKEHLEGNCEIQLHKEEPNLLRVRLRSRHCSSRSYLLWVKYDSASVVAWYCRCRSGSRVVGVCAHIAAVIWYLGFYRHTEDMEIGVNDWGQHCDDAAQMPTEVLDGSDSEGSQTSDIEE